MEPNRGKLLSGTQVSDQETSRPYGSHVVTLDSSLIGIQNPKGLSEYISTEYHLTATIPNRSLSVRDLSLLLDVLNFQCVTYGANFSMILALSELFLRISGGRPVDSLSDARIRLTVSVSHILIQSFRNKDIFLNQGSLLQPDQKICELLSPYLMSKRTYSSRFRHWRPEKWIKIVAVPVSILFERSPRQTNRYSGYTKGYGESHGNAHRKKTKPSYELDGEDVPDRAERNLILRMTDQQHQYSNQLWIKYWNLIEEDL
jgi:hypothetical protein